MPAVYAEQWTLAENRTTCALLAPELGEVVSPGAPRRAAFSGGWAVAYDTPTIRSAFGIAGTGALASGPTYAWPDSIRYADGSTATYGPEGGEPNANQLAYLTIRGQSCLYNVWSRLGTPHLLSLIESLRFVVVR